MKIDGLCEEGYRLSMEKTKDKVAWKTGNPGSRLQDSLGWSWIKSKKKKKKKL